MSREWRPSSIYEAQAVWAGVYVDGSDRMDRQRLAAVRLFCGLRGSVLDLGAGGGGTADALAEAGYVVTALENDDFLAARAQERARGGRFRLLHADFYDVTLPHTFDLVTYFDGFGLSSDEAQRRLLVRIASWLRPSGRALIEIYAPGYWSAMAGKRVRLGQATREYQFDYQGSRLIDTWTGPTGDEFRQTLRCYAPADLALLLEPTGLCLDSVQSLDGCQWAGDVARTRYSYLAAIAHANPYPTAS